MDTSKFGYKMFDEEIRLEAEFELGHTLLFIYILKNVNFAAKSVKDIKLTVEDLTPEFRENVHFMIAECIKREWL